MNINKIVAWLIVVAIYCGPVGMLFIYNDVLVDTFAEMSLFLIWTFGMIIAFYIGVNEPIGRRERAKKQVAQQAELRKAA